MDNQILNPIFEYAFTSALQLKNKLNSSLLFMIIITNPMSTKTKLYLTNAILYFTQYFYPSRQIQNCKSHWPG
jgi:hypothetical protein